MDKLEEHEVKCPTCEKLHYIELDTSESSHPAVLEEKFCSGGCWDNYTEKGSNPVI